MNAIADRFSSTIEDVRTRATKAGEDAQKNAREAREQAQTRAIDLSSKVAELTASSRGRFDTPFADRLPTPAEAISNYFDFLAEMTKSNRAFAEKLVAPWTPKAAAKPAAKKTAAKKPAAKKTAAKKASAKAS